MSANAAVVLASRKMESLHILTGDEGSVLDIGQHPQGGFAFNRRAWSQSHDRTTNQQAAQHEECQHSYRPAEPDSAE